MKQKTILLVTILPILIIVGLWSLSEMKASRDNGFQRKKSYLLLAPSHILQCSQPIKEVAAITNSFAYITTLSPGQIIVTDHNGIEKQVMRLNVDSIDFQETAIDFPDAYIIGGNKLTVYKCNLETQTSQKLHPPGPMLTRIASLGNGKFVFRQFKNGIRDQVFTRYNVRSNSFHSSKLLPQSFNDGGVITDGMLHYDSVTNRILYVYFRRGVFECLDTALNLLSSYKTIDTFSTFQNTSARIKQRYSFLSFTSHDPAKFINYSSCCADGLLYVFSMARADNEKPEYLSKNMPIDVYAIKNGKYLGSFYLPMIAHEKIQSLKVLGNLLIAVYYTQVGYYKIPSFS
ncbi:hypothetical protein [Pedobacter frigoris]|uniref:hypothetical protein n=1 Tax=Pedobacter frigoris TaxID=2571272 RepID=UPI0029314511|nr:hypothetical protein [Pedobacter frigoris]